MFSADLKPDPNNKDIFNVEYIDWYKIKLEPLKKGTEGKYGLNQRATKNRFAVHNRRKSKDSRK
jgi:hypothetical protein